MVTFLLGIAVQQPAITTEEFSCAATSLPELYEELYIVISMPFLWYTRKKPKTNDLKDICHLGDLKYIFKKLASKFYTPKCFFTLPFHFYYTLKTYSFTFLCYSGIMIYINKVKTLSQAREHVYCFKSILCVENL